MQNTTSALQLLPRPFFVLAPMDDVTDVVFRTVISECAPPDMYFTEFVNVDGLQSPGREKLMPKLRLGTEGKPVIAQVWGLKPENFEKTVPELIEMRYAGVDLNFGCPDKTVVKNGACSAMIHRRELAGEIIEATQRGAAGRVPVSVKTRLGFNEVDLTWHEYLLGFGIDMLSVHFRTRKEMSDVPAQWHYGEEIKRLRDKLSPHTLIVGNGDVANRAQGLELAARHGLDGVMIGRGIFHDPYCFADESPWPAFGKEARTKLYLHHVEQFVKNWSNGERKLHTLNKFCKIYINGFDGAKELREHIMNIHSAEELLQYLRNIAS